MSQSQDQLVELITQRVRERLQSEVVSPNPAVRGTWYDNTALKRWLDEGASRLGTDGRRVGDASAAGGASYIDHTLLKPTSTRKDIVRVCEEARKHGFASVCVNTTWIALTAKLLEGCSTKPIAVVGFPLGAARARQGLRDPGHRGWRRGDRHGRQHRRPEVWRARPRAE